MSASKSLLIRQKLEQVLKDKLNAKWVSIEDISAGHVGTDWDVIVVSDRFAQMNGMDQRNREVFSIIESDPSLKNLSRISLRTWTPEQYEQHKIEKVPAYFE